MFSFGSVILWNLWKMVLPVVSSAWKNQDYQNTVLSNNSNSMPTCVDVFYFDKSSFVLK